MSINRFTALTTSTTTTTTTTTSTASTSWTALLWAAKVARRAEKGKSAAAQWAASSSASTGARGGPGIGAVASPRKRNLEAAQRELVPAEHEGLRRHLYGPNALPNAATMRTRLDRLDIEDGIVGPQQGPGGPVSRAEFYAAQRPIARPRSRRGQRPEQKGARRSPLAVGEQWVKEEAVPDSSLADFNISETLDGTVISASNHSSTRWVAETQESLADESETSATILSRDNSLSGWGSQSSLLNQTADREYQRRAEWAEEAAREKAAWQAEFGNSSDSGSTVWPSYDLNHDTTASEQGSAGMGDEQPFEPSWNSLGGASSMPSPSYYTGDGDVSQDGWASESAVSGSTGVYSESLRSVSSGMLSNLALLEASGDIIDGPAYVLTKSFFTQ